MKNHYHGYKSMKNHYTDTTGQWDIVILDDKLMKIISRVKYRTGNTICDLKHTWPINYINILLKNILEPAFYTIIYCYLCQNLSEINMWCHLGKPGLWRDITNRLWSDAAHSARRLIRAWTFCHIWASAHITFLAFYTI